MRIPILSLLFVTLLLGMIAALSGPESAGGGSRVVAEHVTVAGQDATVWRPPAGGAAPIVIYSHGFGGCTAESSFLARALAESGYLVVAPRHPDAGCSGRSGFPRIAPIHIPTIWTDATWRERHDGVVALLDGLRSDPTFVGRVDWSKFGLMGHSLGGYTVLALAGAWPDWTIPDVKAVVAMSPSCVPFLYPSGRLENLTAPVLFEGGTIDVGITPFLKRRGGCFDKARAPAALLVLRGANHFAWSDSRSVFHDRIIHYTRDFLDIHVRGMTRPSFSIRRHGVAELRTK